MLYLIIYFCLVRIAQPTGTHQLRTFSLNQRLMDTQPYLRDLEPFRRKSLSQLNNNSSSNQGSNTNVSASLECSASSGGYKPNAPQIQGKYFMCVAVKHREKEIFVWIDAIYLRKHQHVYNLG